MGKVIRRGEGARRQAIELVLNGATFKEAADVTGFSHDYIRQLCTKKGIWIPKVHKREQTEIEVSKEVIISLRLRGMKYREISEATGINESFINKVCRDNGLGGTKVWVDKRAAAIKAYKAEGHTHKEVAEKFGISESISMKAAKGIASQAAKTAKRIEDIEKDELDKRGKNIVEKHQPDFEYAGNYTGYKGYVDLMCKRCGGVFKRTYDRVTRPEAIICPLCIELEKEAKKVEEKNKKLEAQRERQVKREKILLKKLQNAEQISFSICESCGVLFYSKHAKKYCEECARKAANRKDKRLKRMSSAIIDKDITLEKLAARDDNKCWLCGGNVDWNDIEVTDTTKIAGDKYPSIDHVIPLVAGGMHAWDNVRLAHRRCNYIKRDSLLPLVHESPEKKLGTGGVTVLELSERETKTGQLMLIC